MWSTPNCVVLAAGAASASTSLNAFDMALNDAGIADFNLIRVSSILPAGALIKYMKKDGSRIVARLTKGMLVPAVYSVATSETCGITIACAVAVGVPRSREQSGVIFEAGSTANRDEVEHAATSMVREALHRRGIEEFDVMVVSSELTIADKTGAVASVALLLQWPLGTQAELSEPAASAKSADC